jgi:hypothetical protein
MRFEFQHGVLWELFTLLLARRRRSFVHPIHTRRRGHELRETIDKLVQVTDD